MPITEREVRPVYVRRLLSVRWIYIRKQESERGLDAIFMNGKHGVAELTAGR